MFPPIFPAIIFLEIIFGLLFDKLVEWAHDNKIWHVSVSVSIGVTGTLVIAVGGLLGTEMPFWHAVLILAACFTASGIPMIIGSTRRTVAESHKRRPWPTSAARARDEAVMELSNLAHEIAEDAKNGRLTAGSLPDFVNRLHQVIGTLKSV